MPIIGIIPVNRCNSPMTSIFGLKIWIQKIWKSLYTFRMISWRTVVNFNEFALCDFQKEAQFYFNISKV